jgi:vancomycin resistance protein YoaR
MQTTAYPRRRTTYRSPARIERSPLDFATIFFGLILITLIIGAFIWQFWHANRIYTGIHVAGVPIGGLTRADAVQTLNQDLHAYPVPSVSVIHDEQRWPLLDEAAVASTGGATTPQLHAEVDLLSAVNQAYLVGRQGSLGEQFLAQMRIALLGQEIYPPLSYDRGQLRYLVSRVAEEVRRPARAGSQVGEVTVPPQPGVDVDVEASLQAVMAALANAGPAQMVTVPLVTTSLAPPTETVTPPATAPPGSSPSPAAGPLLVRNEQLGIEMAVDPAQLVKLLLSTTPPQLDPEGLRALLAEWAVQIDKPARDARLQFNPDTGTINVLQTSQSGYELDIESTATAMQAAMSTQRRQAALVITEVPPAVDMARIPEMGIKELVATGTSYFAGSSAARVRNIEVAAAKFEGVVIPPDGIFSFNEIVEDVTSANGFEDSLIIWGDQTAVGVGGGVCQVSTTVFRAAYLGGFPIVERYNHGYVVSWYGNPGLDATIYTPTVDFRFRNDTDAYLLIDPVVDSVNGVMAFNFYGTKPNRQVSISEAEYTDIIEPEAPRYVEDPSLAAGEIEQVEWEQRGMTVEIQRTITENGETRTDTLRSVYRPWRAEYLYGPGTEIPTPEPTEPAEAEPTETPPAQTPPAETSAPAL